MKPIKYIYITRIKINNRIGNKCFLSIKDVQEHCISKISQNLYILISFSEGVYFPFPFPLCTIDSRQYDLWCWHYPDIFTYILPF